MPAPQAPLFGCLKAPDKHDKLYSIQAVTPVDEPIPLERSWSFLNSMRLIQRGGTCVGHGIAHMLACAPYRHAVAPDLPYKIYNWAQLNDEWPGIDYEGTSVRAGLKAAQAFGLIGEYRWAFKEDEAWQYLMTRGPLVVGFTWLTGMMAVDRKGFVNLTGGEEGGHCVCLRRGERTLADGDYYQGIQSWPDYLSFKIRREDFKALHEEMGGDVASAMEIKPA